MSSLIYCSTKTLENKHLVIYEGSLVIGNHYPGGKVTDKVRYQSQENSDAVHSHGVFTVVISLANTNKDTIAWNITLVYRWLALLFCASSEIRTNEMREFGQCLSVQTFRCM